MLFGAAKWPFSAISPGVSDSKPAASRWTADVVEPAALSAREIQIWRGICDSLADFRSPFFAPAFTLAVGSARGNTRVCVIKRDGEAAGFFPFQFAGKWQFLLGAAQRVGGDMSDKCGVISLYDLQIGPQELLGLAGLSSFEFNYMQSHIPSETRSASADRPALGLTIDLREGGIAYWANLKKENRDFSSQVERKERQLAAKFGPIRYTFDAGAEARQTELARLVQVKGEQYKRTVGRDHFKESWRCDLLAQLLAGRDGQCAGVLSTLYAGETWLASHYGLRSRSVLHQWFPVYNMELSKFSPGHVLTRYMSASASEEGFSEFDLGSDSSYKRLFRPEPYSMTSGLWVRNNAYGMVSHVNQSISWRIAAATAKLRQYRGRDRKSSPAGSNG